MLHITHQSRLHQSLPELDMVLDRVPHLDDYTFQANADLEKGKHTNSQDGTMSDVSDVKSTFWTYHDIVAEC